MFTRRAALIGAVFVAAPAYVINTTGAQEVASNGGAKPADFSALTRRKLKLAAPPFVHAHQQVATTGPEIIEFEMKIVENEIQFDEEVWLQTFTFNGSTPGPMMVVHHGGYVELTLFNPPLDHAAAHHRLSRRHGRAGWGAMTLVNLGEKTVLRFKATTPKVFVYHCAPGGLMIPWHVVSGMSGCIIVPPIRWLTDYLGQPVSYDRVCCIGENDFYIPRGEDGAYTSYADLGESYPDTLEVMNGLIRTHVVFNGKVGALTDDNALTAERGETVLFVHSQANRDSPPHLIGGHGDLIWEAGEFNYIPGRNLETWFIRGGSAGAALYTFLQPSVYACESRLLIATGS